MSKSRPIREHPSPLRFFIEQPWRAGMFALLGTLVAGCDATGECLDAARVTLLRPGQSRIEEVRRQFGAPKHESAFPFESGRVKLLTYGPRAADYALTFDDAGALIRFGRLGHTACVSDGDPSYVWNVPIRPVDERRLAGFHVGLSTQVEVALALGACTYAEKLDNGDYQVVWGPSGNDWVFEFRADGVLARPPVARVWPRAGSST